MWWSERSEEVKVKKEEEKEKGRADFVRRGSAISYLSRKGECSRSEAS